MEPLAVPSDCDLNVEIRCAKRLTRMYQGRKNFFWLTVRRTRFSWNVSAATNSTLIASDRPSWSAARLQHWTRKPSRSLGVDEWTWGRPSRPVLPEADDYGVVVNRRESEALFGLALCRHVTAQAVLTWLSVSRKQRCTRQRRRGPALERHRSTSSMHSETKRRARFRIR